MYFNRRSLYYQNYPYFSPFGYPQQEEQQRSYAQAALAAQAKLRAYRLSAISQQHLNQQQQPQQQQQQQQQPHQPTKDVGNDGVSFVRGSVGTPAAGGQGDFTPYGYVSRPGSTPLSYSLWGSSASTTSSEDSYRRYFSRSLCRVVFGCAVILVVLAVLGIVGIAVYLGVLTNEEEGSEYEVRYNGQLRVSRGDTWIPPLQLVDSPAFKAKAHKYEKMMEAVYENSFLRGSLRRAKVVRFLKNNPQNKGLHMLFKLALDRRKMPSHVDNTVMAVRDVLLQELMSLEPVAFQNVAVDIDSLKISRDTEIGGVEVAKASLTPVPVKPVPVPANAGSSKKEDDVQVIKVEGTQQAPGGAIMIRKPSQEGKVASEAPTDSSTVANLVYEFGPWRPVDPFMFSPSPAIPAAPDATFRTTTRRSITRPFFSPTRGSALRPAFITGPRENSVPITTPITVKITPATSSTTSSSTTSETTTSTSTTTTTTTTPSTTTTTTTTTTTPATTTTAATTPTTTSTTPLPTTTSPSSLFNDRIGMLSDIVDNYNNNNNKMTTKRNPSREDFEAILAELLFFTTPRPEPPPLFSNNQGRPESPPLFSNIKERPESPLLFSNNKEGIDPLLAVPDSTSATETSKSHTTSSGDRLITFQSISAEEEKNPLYSTSHSSSISNTATTVSMQVPESPPQVTSYTGIRRPVHPRPLPHPFPLDRFRHPPTSSATGFSSATTPFDIWNMLSTRKPLIINTELVTSTSMDVEYGATERYPVYKPTQAQESTRFFGPVYRPTSSLAPVYRPNKKLDIGTTDQYAFVYQQDTDPVPLEDITDTKNLVSVPVISANNVRYLTVNKTRSNYPNVVIVNLQTTPEDDHMGSTTPMTPFPGHSRRLNTKYLEDAFKTVLENLNYRGVDGATHSDHPQLYNSFSHRQGKPIDLDASAAASHAEESSKSHNSISLWSVLRNLSQAYLSDPAIIQQLIDFEKASNSSGTSDFDNGNASSNPTRVTNVDDQPVSSFTETAATTATITHHFPEQTETTHEAPSSVSSKTNLDYSYIPLRESSETERPSYSIPHLSTPSNSNRAPIHLEKHHQESSFQSHPQTPTYIFKSTTSSPFTTLFMTGMEGKSSTTPQIISVSSRSPGISSTSSTTNSPIHTFVLKDGQSMEELLQEIFDTISLEEENETSPVTEEEIQETETTTLESQTTYQTTHSTDDRTSILESINKILSDHINRITNMEDATENVSESTTETPEITTMTPPPTTTTPATTTTTATPATTKAAFTRAHYSTTRRPTTLDNIHQLFPVMTRPMHPIRYTTTTEAYEILDDGDNEIRTTLLGTSPPPTTEMRTETSVDISYSVHSGTTELNFRKNYTIPVCSSASQFRCDNGECIPEFSRCNLIQDCKDSSDESNCSCSDFLKSKFLNRKICDGIVDCWDHSDETNCDWCRPGQFICTGSSQCIEQSQVCDGVTDCDGGDDEKTCVTIAPDVPSANSLFYHDEGYLMVRKKGQWGKLCVENFESAMAKAATSWTINDLGQAVCKTLTFNDFRQIKRLEDPIPLSRSAPPESVIASMNSTKTLSRVDPPIYYSIEVTNSLLRARARSHIYHTGSASGVIPPPLRTRNSESFSGDNLRMSLEFKQTTCPRRDVVKVACSSLHCGMRPRAVSHKARYYRSGGLRQARIVGGSNSGPGSWPWHAALYKEGEYQCGATLINHMWLVSAGHCFYSATSDYWVARLGALRRGTKFPSPYEQLRHITHIFIHPEYVDTGFINDISLLRVNEPVSYTDYVRPVCLPPPGTTIRSGRLCTLIGWGQLFEVGKIFPDTLQEVQVPLISTPECRKRTVFIPLYRITEDMFCAGYDRGGRDACLGDSGGPLMCQEPNGSWQLVGVTSNGYGCARPHRPGVYTKVVKYLDWMNQVMEITKSDLVVPVPSGCEGHRCPLGQCLPQSKVCNGFVECSDGSDEADCN